MCVCTLEDQGWGTRLGWSLVVSSWHPWVAGGEAPLGMNTDGAALVHCVHVVSLSSAEESSAQNLHCSLRCDGECVSLT